jgi:ribonucleoside-diphosphate reductase alpha chain
MLIEQGVPYKPEVGQDKENAITFVLEFPVKSPDGIKVKTTALEQLGYWSKVKLNFTEHNPSTTITVKDNEWIDVINWLYNHWHNLGGLSFMPADNHAYQLAPYEQITEDKYNELISKFPNIDFSQIVLYEDKNELSMTGEIACTANGCEII